MPRVPQGYLDARRNEIIDAAMACFQEKGFHQTTVQDICRQADLSPGAVYRYFKSKDEIIAVCTEKSWAVIPALAQGAIAGGAGSGGALQAIASVFFDRFHQPDFEDGARLDMEIWAEVTRQQADPELKAVMRSQYAMLHRLLTGLIADRAEQVPQLRGVKPEWIANLVMAAYVGLEYVLLVDPEHVDTDGVLEFIRRMLAIGPAPAGANANPPAAEDGRQESGEVQDVEHTDPS